MAGSLAKRKGEEDKGFLLVTRLGKQISRGWITKRVTACTKLLVGIALSPQKLRRATATSISSSMPEMAYLATLQLQHYDRRETEGYDQSCGLSAALMYDDTMEEKYSVELTILMVVTM